MNESYPQRFSWLGALIILCFAGFAFAQVADFRAHAVDRSNGAALGYAVAGAGDVDGDGHADVIVGRYALDSEVVSSQSGRAYLISGRDNSILRELQAPGRSQHPSFGRAVAGAGDVNNDGYADVMVGAPEAGSDRSGRACVFSGADGSLLYALNSQVGGTGFGWSVAIAGDADCDGYADVTVGTERAGQAFVFSGRDGSLMHHLQRNEPAGSFGYSVAGARDVDNDGYADVVVGAYQQGRAYVFSGNNSSLLYELSSPKEGSGDYFGISVAGAGDVDNDGYADEFNFGNIDVGQSSGTQNFNISNVGSATLSVTSVSLSGANPGEFTLTSVSPFSLGPGTSQSVKVAYTPTSDGAHSATLIINSDDPDENPFNVSLQGIGLAPSISATKVDAHLNDLDSDGQVDPGETVRYTVVVSNSGTGSAFNVNYNSGVDPNSSLTTGTVTTTSGVVTSGNNAGHTSVGVFVGTIPVSGSVTITYDVTVNAAFPAGVVQIACQGTVSGDNFSNVVTDDADTGAQDDATVNNIDVSPAITAVKTDALFNDLNSNGTVEPGETVQYMVVITNNGSQDANGATYTSSVDANSALVVGSVTTTQGSVTLGNTGGDTSVGVNAGIIPALSGSVTVEIPLTQVQAFHGDHVRVMIPLQGECPTCRGRGGVGPFECLRCQGQGTIAGETPVSVSFPAGISDNEVVQIPLDHLGIENLYLSVRFRVTETV